MLEVIIAFCGRFSGKHLGIYNEAVICRRGNLYWHGKLARDHASKRQSAATPAAHGVDAHARPRARHTTARGLSAGGRQRRVCYVTEPEPRASADGAAVGGANRATWCGAR